MKEFIMKLSKSQRIIIGLICIIIIIVYFILHNYFYNTSSGMTISNETSEEKWESISTGSYAKKEGIIVINVVGEVNNPGVVTLEEGARIIDAINAAGGKTDKADISEINLAYILDDGVRLYIPSFNETKERKLENITESKETITSGAGNTIVLESVSEEKESKQNKKININTAKLEELKQLPGVGDAVAKAIIDYREKNGKFKNIEDIKKVPGIGESKFTNLEKLISVK